MNKPKFIPDSQADAFFGTSTVNKPKFISDAEAESFFSTPKTPVTPQAPVTQEQRVQTNTDTLDKKNSLASNLFGASTNLGNTLLQTGLGGAKMALRASKYEPISKITNRLTGNFVEDVRKEAINNIDKAQTFLKGGRVNNVGGTVGNVVGTVAPYLATAGAVNPVTANLGTVPRVLARAGADVAVSQAQTGGDAKVGLATGVTSAFGDALLGGKSKVIRGLIPSLKQIGKTTSSGYVSDVSSGMAGMRGEDRTGAKAFIPGAGTVIGGALGTAQVGISAYKNLKNPDIETINKAKAELEDSYVKFYGGTQAGKKKIDKALFAMEMKDRAGTSGLAPHQILAQDAVIPEIKGNQFDTWEQARQYKEQTLKVAKESKKILREVELQTPRVKLTDLESEAIQRARTQQNIDAGDDVDLIRNIRREFAKLRNTYGNEIPLSKVDDIKSARWSKIDFSKQNPFAPRVDKLSSDADYLIAKTAQKKIEDVATQAGLEDVAQFNRDIGDRLESAKFLADLNGKTLKGSFTTRMASRIIGASAGTTLPGSILGAIGGDYVANMLVSNSVASPTKRLILANIQSKSPESYTKVMEWLTKQGLDRDLRLALPEASAIYVAPTKQAPTSKMIVTGGNKAPVDFAQAQKRASGLPEYGGLYEYNQSKIATDKAVGKSVLPKPNANKGTAVKRSPNVPSKFKVEDVSQYSLPSKTSIAEPIKTPKSIVISKSITIPKGSSIDQTREIVNNHLKTTLQTISDVDTFDMISANPQAFYRQQIDDIAMGLRAENTKYKRLADSISSIDTSKINDFETLASKIREKLNAKTLMETITGKGLPNRQGGFVKNPLAQSNIPSKDIIIPKEDIKIYRGEGKGIGNTTLVKGRYFAESPKFASTFGDVSEFTIPKGAKIFNLDSVKRGDSYIAQDMLVQPEKLTKYLLDKGFEFTKNTNSRGVEYVRLGDNIDQLTNIIKRNGFKNKSEFLEYLADKGYNDGKGIIGKQLGDTDVAWNRYTGKDYVKAPSKADVRVYTKSDPLIQEAKKYKSAEEFVKAVDPISFYKVSPKEIGGRQIGNYVSIEAFPKEIVKGKGITKSRLLDLMHQWQKEGYERIVAGGGGTTKAGEAFNQTLIRDGFLTKNLRFTEKLRDYKTKSQLEDIWKQASKGTLPKNKK